MISLYDLHFFKHINFDIKLEDLCIIFDISSEIKLCDEKLSKKEIKKRKKYLENLKKNINKSRVVDYNYRISS